VPAGSYDGHVPAPQAAAAVAGSPSGWRETARRRAAALARPSPALMRATALAGVIASAGVMLTGAGVRLSQSGLGCPDWPDCTAHSVLAGGATGDPLIHRWVEFGNRLFGVFVFVVAIAVLVAACRYRPAGRRRRDLIGLATLQPAGVLAQAVIGGVVVLTKLNPVWVSVHFLLSLGVVAGAVALLVRCTEGTGPAQPTVRPEVRLFTFGALGVVGLMVTAGTVVTGTGPLAGAASVARYHFPLAAVTQLHADVGWLLSGVVIALVLALRLTGAPQRVTRLGWLLLALIGVQGVIGYVQYFSGLPAGLVWFHVAGAILIWITMLRLTFATRNRGEATAMIPATGPATEEFARPAATAGPP
jgi:cytochrome c oxidase assembly protein subunit 15